MWPLKGPVALYFGTVRMGCCLAAEAVQGAALPLQSVDDVHGSDGLPLGMLGVGDGIPDDVLKEDLEDATGLLIDEARDTLDTATARQTADGGLGDALDVVPEDLPVALGASLSESLASFATSSHVDAFFNSLEMIADIGQDKPFIQFSSVSHQLAVVSDCLVLPRRAGGQEQGGSSDLALCAPFQKERKRKETRD